jgi:hypothetical protein
MREMILNDASGGAHTWSDAQANKALIDLAQGMATLVDGMALPKTLRLQRSMDTIQVTQSASLWDLLLAMQRAKISREEVQFWLSLAQKMPLLADLPSASIDHFYACESDASLGESAQALMLCVHQSAIAISFPSTPKWDTDSLDMPFTEIMADGSMTTASEPIDNLARSAHAPAILARHQQQNYQKNFEDLNPATFWENRALVFPALFFGLDVKDHISSVGGSQFETIMRRLADLNASAAAWKSGPAPDWKTKVTPESDTVRKNPKLIGARYFRCAHGGASLYEWHARYGSGGRIHFRFDAADKSVEIGYIGPHLPLPL